jgi:hypothetical protein
VSIFIGFIADTVEHQRQLEASDDGVQAEAIVNASILLFQ